VLTKERSYFAATLKQAVALFQNGCIGFPVACSCGFGKLFGEAVQLNRDALAQRK